MNEENKNIESEITQEKIIPAEKPAESKTIPSKPNPTPNVDDKTQIFDKKLKEKKKP